MIKVQMDSDALVFLCKTEGILSRAWVYEIPRFGVINEGFTGKFEHVQQEKAFCILFVRSMETLYV